MVKIGVIFMSFFNSTCHFRATADFTLCSVCTLGKVSCSSEMASSHISHFEYFSCFYKFLQIIIFSVENSTAGAVIVEASLSCSIFMMRQKILYRKEVCPLRYIKVSTDQQYTMYLRPCDVSISSIITLFLFQNFMNVQLK